MSCEISIDALLGIGSEGRGRMTRTPIRLSLYGLHESRSDEGTSNSTQMLDDRGITTNAYGDWARYETAIYD